MSDTPALEVTSLRFRYGRRQPWVVEIPSLSLERGDQFLLTGGSGRGKSTLLHLIAGLIDPKKGVVRIAGQPVHKLHRARRDRFRGSHVGMIFQTFNLLQGFSALENVEAALMFSERPRDEHRARARELLQRLGIERPRQRPEHMSVGQQQRVAVARAIACSPDLVLADEPTASLDPDNAGTAMDLIQEICREQNAALLVTSHDPTMPQRFPNHMSLDDLASPVPALPLDGASADGAE